MFPRPGLRELGGDASRHDVADADIVERWSSMVDFTQRIHSKFGSVVGTSPRKWVFACQTADINDATAARALESG